MAWLLMLGSVVPAYARPAATASVVAATPAHSAELFDAHGHAVEVDTRQPLRAGLFINGHEYPQGIDLLRRKGGYAVDLDALAKAIAAPLHRQGGSLVLSTPLGDARLPRAQLIRRVGERFLALPTLAVRLGARLRFDLSEFALRVDLPWQPGAAAATARQVKPDVRAPRVSLSRWHSEVYAGRSGGRDTLSSLTELGGALGVGAWQLRYRSEPGNRHVLENYGWLVDRSHSRLWLGNGQLTLDPLLPYTELTGVQYAWSNQPRAVFSDAGSAGDLLGGGVGSGRTLSGVDGPPGGIAELRVDGKVTARTAIRLDGSWRFSGVVLPSGEHAEVALYKRFGDGTPVRVVEVDNYGNARLLPKGALLSYAGAGADGNPLDPLLGTHGGAGFYQLGYGVSRHLTVGTTLQHTVAGDYAVANAVAGLDGMGTWALSAGHHGGASGWSVRGDGSHGRWFWSAFALHDDAGYQYGSVAGRDDRYGEFGARFGQQFSASLIARKVRDPISGDDYSYVRPALAWRAGATLSMDARPDYRGHYAFDASWTPDQDHRLSFSRYADQTQVSWEQGIGEGYQLDLSAVHDRRLGSRVAALISGVWRHAPPVQWSAGPMVGEGHVGYLLDAGVEAVPGLTAHLQVLNDPLNRNNGLGTIVQLVLVADFAVTPAGLARASYDSGLAHTGAISGRVHAQLPEGVSWSDLAGVGVLINGQPRGRLDAAGHYIVQGLAPGVYQLQLDSDKLPIDLGTDVRAPWVQVRAGATTRFDFNLRLQLGFAGQVRDAAGHPLVGIQVRVSAADGTVKSVTTNRWGYYRVDGLVPGRYRVQAGAYARTVELRRRFLFGRDLAPIAGH